jgi:hypothetical protein
MKAEVVQRRVKRSIGLAILRDVMPCWTHNLEPNKEEDGEMSVNQEPGPGDMLLWKQTLDPKLFIYLAATNEDFRTKYFDNLDALAKDFDISADDLGVIKSINFVALKGDLDALSADIQNQEKASLGGGTCHDNGHCSSQGAGHTSCRHCNDCPSKCELMLSEELAKLAQQ